ncbi:MAG: HAD family hydrolase [Thaumarchaeota archaeon]|nr:HAD family hydrolase [Nitrososphaerota archaeon]
MLDPSKIRMIVCDFDRTLTDEDLTPSVEAFAAIRDAKGLGLRFIVVSGRQLDFLLSIEEISQLADAVVAENGAIAYELSTSKKLSPFVKEAKIIKQAFQKSGLRFLQFDVMTSLSISYVSAVKELIAKNKLQADIHFNVDSIMVLPLGVTKASGLSLALGLMGAPKDGIIGFGDGENDLPLFEESDIAVAVANALPEVKAQADIVTTLTGGSGVAEQIRKMLPTIGRI